MKVGVDRDVGGAGCRVARQTKGTLGLEQRLGLGDLLRSGLWGTALALGNNTQSSERRQEESGGLHGEEGEKKAEEVD